MANVEAKTFESFLQGKAYKSSVIESIDPASGKNNADVTTAPTRSRLCSGQVADSYQLEHYRGRGYDYHGGLTRSTATCSTSIRSLYSVTGTSDTGFQVGNTGFVVAPNNSNAAR